MPKNNTVLIDLTHQRLISVIGPDAGTFLQGQVTCDINALGPVSRLGAHCNHKGRVLCTFRAVKLSDSHIALRMHQGISESAQQGLGKYIVFSKAELKDTNSDYRLLGLSGPQAETLITQHLGIPPQENQSVTLLDDGCIIKISHQRFECWVKKESDAWQKLSADCETADINDWALLDIRDGLGELRPGNEAAFIPQMLNLQAVDGVSFEKGCYTGQEVVARMQYLGKMKRQMFRVNFSTDNGLPQTGAKLYSEGTSQSVGEVVMAATLTGDNSDDNIVNAEALVVMTKEAADSNSAFLDKNHTQKLNLLELPYTIN